jgi:cephalosporin hydroxylase
MKIVIDDKRQTLICQEEQGSEELPLYSNRAFEILSDLWVKVGWNQKYAYTFTWLGRPIIQLPEDLLRIQEVLHEVQPDVIVETGVAHGGSLVFYATICRAIGRGRVIGVDIEIRPPNRQAIETHPLSNVIQLIEGDSASPATVAAVQALIAPGESVLVLLDSCHTKAHVRRELEAYSALVTPGSYLVATDGVMKDLHDVPRGRPDWAEDHPTAAAAEFASAHPEFVWEQPPWRFNESTLGRATTWWPGAFLRRGPA